MICTKSVSGPTFKTDLIPLQRKDSIFEPHQRQDSNMHLKLIPVILKQPGQWTVWDMDYPGQS